MSLGSPNRKRTLASDIGKLFQEPVASRLWKHKHVLLVEQSLIEQTLSTADPSSGSTNASLLLGLKAHDKQAWQQFVELYATLVFNWCRISRLGSADSADVMQEVFASVSTNISRFERKPDGTMRGWLWTITHNKIRDHFRQKNIGIADGGTAL